MASTTSLSLFKEFADRLSEGNHSNFPLNKATALEVLSQAANCKSWHEARKRLEAHPEPSCIKVDVLSGQIEELLFGWYIRGPVILAMGESGPRQVAEKVASFAVKRTDNLCLVYDEQSNSGGRELRFMKTLRAAELDEYYFDTIEQLRIIEDDSKDSGWTAVPDAKTREVIAKVPGLLAKTPEWYGGYTLLAIAYNAHGQTIEEASLLRGLASKVEENLPKYASDKDIRVEWYCHDNRNPLRALHRFAEITGRCRETWDESKAWKERLRSWSPRLWDNSWSRPSNNRSRAEVGL